MSSSDRPGTTEIEMQDGSPIDRVLLTPGPEGLQVKVIPHPPAAPSTLVLEWGETVTLLAAGLRAMSQELGRLGETMRGLTRMMDEWIQSG